MNINIFHKNKNKTSFSDRLMVGWEEGHKNNCENGNIDI
jgi:hypothetical protein